MEFFNYISDDLLVPLVSSIAVFFAMIIVEAVIIFKRRNRDRAESKHMIDSLSELTDRKEKLHIKAVNFMLNNSVDDKIVEDLRNDNQTIEKEYNETVNKLIVSHHDQMLFFSKVQFWISSVAAVVGLLFIICIITFNSNAQWYEYLVGVVPGAVVEAISVMFISQSNENRKISSDFLNKLRDDKRYERGINVTELISDDKLRDSTRSKIALELCNIDINDDVK